MTDFSSFTSPLFGDQNDQHTTDLQQGLDAIQEEQNYVVLGQNDERSYFSHIINCCVNPNGNLVFFLAWLDTVPNLDLILNDTPVHAHKLCHNDGAIAWTVRFEKWANKKRHNLPVGTVIQWGDMKYDHTMETTLSTWLESHGLSSSGQLLVEHGCISINMLSYLNKDTLLNWGMLPLPARVMMEHIHKMNM